MNLLEISHDAMRKELLRLLVTSLITTGHLLSVDNGGDAYEIEKSADVEKILETMQATADEELHAEKDGKRYWVNLIYGYGNLPWEMIADYHVGLEEIMVPILALADTYCEQDTNT